MIHNLTAGYFDRNGAVTKPLDMRIVRALLAELGGTDPGGVTSLGGWKVRFEDGCVILPWLGGTTIRIADEFAIPLQRETGCQLVDSEHGRTIDTGQLDGLTNKVDTTRAG
jgi:hypothetical protein